MAVDSLAELESLLGHVFRDQVILRQAMTHASATVDPCTDNERLEFLGDGVVGLAVNHQLYRSFTLCAEGVLTEIKSAVVSASALARRARALGLERFAILGKGMPKASGLSDAVHANLFEALVGALYLDAGFDFAREFVLEQLHEEIEAHAGGTGERNYKSLLQKEGARAFDELPRYVLISESGPEHRKVFEVAAVVGERTFPPARGRTKKEAEQRAASNALEELAGEKA